MSHSDSGVSVPVRVLIADDARETRRSTRLMLSAVPDVEVVAMAQNGRQAIDLTLAHKPDIVIMDINMPDLDGLQALQAMRQREIEMACILISVERDVNKLRQAITAGTQAFLTKPFTLHELQTAVLRIRETVWQKRRRLEQVAQLRRQRDTYMRELARTYLSTFRTDEKATRVYEELAQNPDCDLYLLKALAVIYIFRQQWTKVGALAERLAASGAIA